MLDEDDDASESDDSFEDDFVDETGIFEPLDETSHDLMGRSVSNQSAVRSAQSTPATQHKR